MPEHTGDGEIKDCNGRTCTCGVGPWGPGGVCDRCGGVNRDLVPFLQPHQLDFATDDMLIERLRRIEEDAAYVRTHIERGP